MLANLKALLWESAPDSLEKRVEAVNRTIVNLAVAVDKRLQDYEATIAAVSASINKVRELRGRIPKATG